MTLFISFLALVFLLGFYARQIEESKYTLLLIAACTLIGAAYFFVTRLL